MKFTLFIILIFCRALSIGQEITDSNTIGFGCDFSGSPTRPVAMAMIKFQEKNYDSFKKDLENNNPARQYLAVLILEELASSEKITLTEKEASIMNAIKESDEVIGYCSGCTVFGRLSLSEAFARKDSYNLLDNSKAWLQELMKSD